MGDFLVPEEMNNDCRKTVYAGTVGRVFSVLYNREFLFTDFQECYLGVAKSEVCCFGYRFAFFIYLTCAVHFISLFTQVLSASEVTAVFVL
jgi:hypothetical protein